MPDGSRTVIANDVRSAVWPDAGPVATAIDRYPLEVPKGDPSDRIELRNNTLVRIDSAGHESVLFVAAARLSELTISPDRRVAYVVEQTA